MIMLHKMFTIISKQENRLIRTVKHSLQNFRISDCDSLDWKIPVEISGNLFVSSLMANLWLNVFHKYFETDRPASLSLNEYCIVLFCHNDSWESAFKITQIIYLMKIYWIFKPMGSFEIFEKRTFITFLHCKITCHMFKLKFIIIYWDGSFEFHSNADIQSNNLFMFWC